MRSCTRQNALLLGIRRLLLCNAVVFLQVFFYHLNRESAKRAAVTDAETDTQTAGVLHLHSIPTRNPAEHFFSSAFFYLWPRVRSDIATFAVRL